MLLKHRSVSRMLDTPSMPIMPDEGVGNRKEAFIRERRCSKKVQPRQRRRRRFQLDLNEFCVFFFLLPSLVSCLT